MATDCVTFDCRRAFGYEGPGRLQPVDAAEREVRKKTQAIAGTPASTITEVQEETEQTPQETDRTPGAIRLLQQGHFQGVADLRLRINFHEEIAVLERQRLQALAEENIAGLQQTVTDGLNTMVDAGLTEQQIADLTSTFAQTVDGLLEGSADTVPLSRGTLVTGLESAFDSLLTALPAVGSSDPTESQAVLPATNEASEQLAAADRIADDGYSGALANLQRLVEQLTSAFSDALEVFTHALDDIELMPALSAPKGNGVAYEKFLAVYNDLIGTGTQTPLAAEDIIDAVA